MIPWWIAALACLGFYAYGYFYGRALLVWQLREEIDVILEAKEKLGDAADLFHAMREDWDKEDNND